MKKLVVVLLVAVLALSLLSVSHVAAVGKVVRLTLIDENGSGEDGSAQLTDQGDGTTKVELIMQNTPAGAAQPAHIHKGSCATLDPAPAYPLNSVTDGKSTTTVPVKLDDLLAAKYAVNVHKSAAEAAVYVSCGNLPSAATTGAAQTLTQIMTALLDQANELYALVQKKEVDSSQNAYTLFHGLFAANENAIKAQSAGAQASVDTAMTAVGTALQAGDWTKSAAAADKLVAAVKAAQGMVGGSTGSTGNSALMTAMSKLQTAAGDLVRETTNKDTAGAQQAYTKFHDLFAANEGALKAQNADAQLRIETAMRKVRDALAAGDWTKAATAATETQNEVNNAIRELGAMTNTLPTSGNGTLPQVLLALAVSALVLLGTGSVLRRRPAR